MGEEDEGDIEDVVGEEESYEKVEREGENVDLAVGSFDIEKLLQASFIDDHFSNVLVLVLDGNVQWRSIAIIFNHAIATPHQQLFDNAAIATHDCEMQRCHSIGKVLLIKFGSPSNKGIGSVFLPRVACPVESSAPLSIFGADFHALIEVIVLIQTNFTISTGESP